MKYFLILLALLLSETLSAQTLIEPLTKQPTSIAIVVDQETYNKTSEAVLAYRDAVEKDGLSAYVLVNSWKNPEEIKNELLKLYNGKPKLEGAVFIGDIPVPMIRNAQHMSSAFKLDEDRYPWNRSSIASDRFYDDFDLKFGFLKQDSVNNLLFYYSLLPESPQRIEKDIYVSRIKPSGDDKYEKISKYLLRVSAQKNTANEIDNMMVFTGHGYNSESLSAWADERLSLREQFPQLFTSEGRIKIWSFAMGGEMKEKILSEIQDKDLDIAIFHAHGDEDMQLILSYPVPQNTQENIDAVKLYLRSKIRSARDRNQSVEDAKKYFMTEYDVPEDWFEGAFEDSVIKADSLLAYKLDIYINDVRNITPGAKFIMFDQCFNSSFQQKEYIAGEYVFGNGSVIAAEGNSVNVLQDKWADEYLGLLNLGVRIGNWHKLKNHIESNLTGDPTYHFTSAHKYNLNQALVTGLNDASVWKKFLSSDSDELRALAIRKLFRLEGSKYESDLVKFYLNEKSINVRLHALKSLAELNSPAFNKVLYKSVNDPFEYIRRKSADWMGETGDTAYIPFLVKVMLTDESERVIYNAKSSLEFLGAPSAFLSVENTVDNLPAALSRERIKNYYRASFKRTSEWLNDELIPHIFSDTLKLKSKLSEIRTFRNYRFKDGISHLIKLAADTNADPKVRLFTIEALGWYTFSLQRDKIIELCTGIISSTAPKDLIDEAIRTKNRLMTGSNDVMLP